MKTIKIASYDEVAHDNSAISQLVLNFMQQEIVLLGPLLPIQQWYIVGDKKELLELTHETHDFGFLKYGSGKIIELVDNGEFLRYILGRIKTEIPLAITNFLGKENLNYSIALEFYVSKEDGEKELITQTLFFEQSLEDATMYHAYDLLAIKSILFYILKEFHEHNITLTLLSSFDYKANLNFLINKTQIENDNDDNSTTV